MSCCFTHTFNLIFDPTVRNSLGMRHLVVITKSDGTSLSGHGMHNACFYD